MESSDQTVHREITQTDGKVWNLGVQVRDNNMNIGSVRLMVLEVMEIEDDHSPNDHLSIYLAMYQMHAYISTYI